MKLSKKIAIISTAIVLITLIFGVTYKISNAQLYSQKSSADQSMYQTLKKRGSYRSNRGDLTVLTADGQKLLKSNLTFEGDPKKPTKNIGFNFKKGYVTKGMTEGDIEIPKNLKSGDIIQTKLPFSADLLTGNTKLKLFLKDRELVYDRNSLQRIGEDKESKIVGVMVGYNYHKGKRIEDEQILADYRGQKVRYRFEGELYIPKKDKKKYNSSVLKKPLIIRNQANYQPQTVLYSFDVVGYKKAPKIYHLSAKLDNLNIKNKLAVDITAIENYSNNIKRYQVKVYAKEPIKGDKLEISTTISGNVSFQTYDSNGVLNSI